MSVKLRWVDVNKGTTDKPFIRSRLVARQLKCRSKEVTAQEVFSAMPPTEAGKLMASLLVSLKHSPKGHPLKLGFYDISRAHVYGRPKTKMYVDLPEEEAPEGKCGELLATMYGSRGASQA